MFGVSGAVQFGGGAYLIPSGDVTVDIGRVVTPQLCLGGECRTSWGGAATGGGTGQSPTPTVPALCRNGLPIRRRRLELGLGQKQVASALGYVAHSQVWKIERVRPGKEPVCLPRTKFAKLAEPLQTTFEELYADATDAEYCESDAEPDCDRDDESAFAGVYVRRVVSPVDPDVDGFLRLYATDETVEESDLDLIRWLAVEETRRPGLYVACPQTLLVAKRGIRVVGYLRFAVLRSQGALFVRSFGIEPNNERAASHALRLLFQRAFRPLEAERETVSGILYRIATTDEDGERTRLLRRHAVAWSSRLAGRPTDAFPLGDSALEYVPIVEPNRPPEELFAASLVSASRAASAVKLS